MSICLVTLFTSIFGSFAIFTVLGTCLIGRRELSWISSFQGHMATKMGVSVADVAKGGWNYFRPGLRSFRLYFLRSWFGICRVSWRFINDAICTIMVCPFLFNDVYSRLWFGSSLMTNLSIKFHICLSFSFQLWKLSWLVLSMNSKHIWIHQRRS